MPNYDLGIAHGKIEVTTDLDGFKKTSRELKKLEAESKLASDKFRSMELSMRKVERSNLLLAKSMNKTTSKIRGLRRDLKNSSSSTRKLASDMVQARQKIDDVTQSVGLLQRALNALAIKSLNTFLNIREAGSSISAFRKLRIGMQSFGISMANAKSHAKSLAFGLSGIRKEMENSPAWRRNMMRFAGSIGSVAAAMTLLSKFKTIRRLGFLFGGGFGGGIGGSSYSSITKFIRGIKNLHSSAGALSRSLTTLGISTAAVAIGVRKLANSFQFIKKIPVPVFAAIVGTFQVLPELLGSTARGLRITSNFLVGTTGALRQLSGMFLALPGIVGLAGAGIATLVTVFSGLKDQFKDIFSTDAEKAQKAFDNLDDHLKPLATSLKGLVKNFRDMRTDLQKVAFAGLEKQIDTVSEKVMPNLKSGMMNVIGPMKQVFNSIFDSFSRPQNQGVFVGMFDRLGQTIKQFAPSIKPLADGMTRLTDSSTKFVSEGLNAMAPAFTRMAEKFSAWTATSKPFDNMVNSFIGLKKLSIGLKDAWMGLYNTLALFATNSGVKGIDSFASAMKRFNQAVQKSSMTGLLARFREFMNSFKENDFSRIKNSFSEIMRVIRALLPVIQTISNAISGPLSFAVDKAITVFDAFLKVIHSLRLDSFAGYVIGIVSAFKLLKSAITPLGSLGMIFTGAVGAVNGFRGSMIAAKGATQQFIVASRAMDPKFTGIGSVANKASRGMALVGRTALSVGSALAGLAVGPVGIAIAAGAALFSVYKAGSNEMEESTESIKNAQANLKAFGKSISQAFVQDQGSSGRNVFSSVSQGVTQMMTDLQEQASKAPGFMAHIKDQFSSNSRAGFWGDTLELNQLQEASKNADRARAKFRDLGMTASDLSKIVMSSDGEFKKWSDSIRASGENGNEAADAIENQRKAYQALKKDFEDIGPGGATLAKGIELISQAAGDASTKLQALRMILQGLGILRTTSYEAAAEYADAVQSLGEKAAEAAANAGDLSQVIDQTTGSLNVNSAAGRALLSVLEPVATAFMNTASTGNDVDEAFQQINSQMQSVADSFHIPVEAVKKLTQELGVVPDIVKISVQLDGKDQLTQDIGQLYMVIENRADKGVGIPLHLTGADTPDAAKEISDQINQILGKAATIADGTKIKLQTELDPRTLQNLQAELLNRGVNVFGGGTASSAPDGALKVPVQPVPVAPNQAGQAQNPVVVGGPVSPSLPNLPNVNLPGAGNPNNRIIPGGPNPPANPKQAPLTVPQQSGGGGWLFGQEQSAMPPAPKSGFLFGEPSQGADLSPQIEKIEEAKSKWSEYSDSVTKAMGDAKEGVSSFTTETTSILNQAASSARDAGEKFGQAYADGISSKSIVAKVAAAAANLANTVKGFFHQSPPKRGPLAAHGDAAQYGGRMFVSSYAFGINSASGLAANAAGNMAGGVYGGISGGFGTFGLNSGGLSGGLDQVLNQTQRVVQFMSDFVGVVQQIGQSLLQLGRVISDPEGKGTFFGKRNFVRDKNVSDKELADKRADEAYAATHNGNIPNQQDKEEKAALKGTAKGRPTSANQTIAAGQPTNRQVAQMIYNRAVDQGYSNSDALAIVAAAQGVSGFNTGKGVFGTPSSTTGLRGGDAAADQVTEFLQQMYQAQSGNIYARIREVGRQNGVDFTDIRRNEPDARILVSPVDHDTGLTTTGQGTKSGRGRRKNVPVTDSLGNTVSSGETTSGVIDRERPGENLDISDELQNSINQALSPLTGVQETNEHLQKIQNAIDQQNELDTPASRATAQGLEGIKSSVLSNKGMTEEQNPIDQMSQGFTSAGNIAQNVFGAIQSGLNAIGGAKELGDMLVRGMSSTDDIVNAVTQVQKFIDFGAKIASTVGSIADLAGQIGGASPVGGQAAQAVSAISSAISGAMQGVNAAIDLAKEGWEIFGSYFGQFLGSLAGGVNQLQGNVRFLLDAKAGQLLAYSADNPMNKTAHGIPGVAPTIGPDNGARIGQINMYSGPGSDPRDDTRNMLFQVQSAQLQGALAS